MLCLSHTLEHRAIAGDQHHDEGDTAGATVQVVILGLAAAFIAAATAGGRRFRCPLRIAREIVLDWTPDPVLTPMARAGPIVLGISRT